MPYSQDDFKQCGRCGSYMPSEWTRCGRCGYPVSGNRRKKGGAGWITILLLIFVAFVFRNQLLNLIPDTAKEGLARLFSSDQTNAGTPATAEGSAGGAETAPIGVDGQTLNPGSADDNQANQPDKTAAGSGSSPGSGDPSNQEEIKNLIHAALKGAEETVQLPLMKTGDDSQVVFKIINQLTLDDPDIMFYKGCTYRTDGLLTLKYEKPRDEILKAVKDTDKKAGVILSKIIKTGMSDYEKELAIHDYIVNSCKYDVENFENDTVPAEGHEAYGPLVSGKAVCEGYAKAMKLLMDRAGVECYVVTGKSKGSLHAWNIVNISGSYYHVDATWDDPVMQNGDQILQHTYFNLTDSDIRIDHSWETADYPKCTSTDANYFYYNKLVASSADAFTKLLGKAVNSGRQSLSVRFIDGSAQNIDFPKVLEKAAAKLNLGSISYSVNDAYGVVDVWF